MHLLLDDTCSVLIHKHNIAPALLTLLKHEVERIRAEESTDIPTSIKVFYAIIGALKNLSLAAADRGLLGSLGTIDKVATLLDFAHLHNIHHGCLTVIRNLCAGNNDGNVYRMMTGLNPSQELSLDKMAVQSAGPGSPLGRIISLVWKAKADGETAVRNEGGRVLVNLVRAISRAGGSL